MYYQNYEDYMRQVLGYPINEPNIYETYDYRNDQVYEDTYSSINQMMSGMSEEEIKNCYPEIYHLVYPMVCKVCETNTEPLTRELIEKMTDEVYMAIEDTTTTVNIRVETPKAEENRSESSSASQIASAKSNTPIRQTDRNTCNTRRETRTNRVEETRIPKAREDRNSKETNAKVIETPKTSSGNVRNAIVEGKSSVIENREPVAKNREVRNSNSNLRDLIKILILDRLIGNRPGNPRPPRTHFPGRPSRPPYSGGPGMPQLRSSFKNYIF